MKDKKQISPLMHELTGYIAGALKRGLPTEVTESAKLHLVDTFAAMVSGSRLVPGKRAIAYVRQLGGTREAGVIGTRIVTSSLHAALANGICGHADESDDGHPPTRLHPGTSIVPAALAMAERQRLSGLSMLRAIVLGYDVSTRLLYALDQAQMAKRGHHPGSKGGLFGVAAVASASLKLNASKIRHVLSYSAEAAAGLITVMRDSEHNLKAYVQGGMPAHNGIAAALMVESGFTGVEDTLTGDSNILSVFSPQPDREALVRGLGKNFEILNCVLKYWPAGGAIQAPLHVLSDLMRQHGFKANDVDKLIVRIPATQFHIVDNREMADLCLQHLLAVMLIDGTVTFATAHDYARMKDPRVLRMRRDHIEAVPDAGLDDPLRRWRCAMEVRLKNGAVYTHQTLSAKGGFDNPLTREQEQEKALDLMGPVLGKTRARALISALFEIDRIKDVRELRKLYGV